MNKKIAALALGAACLSASAGPAMYRCGSSFQDRPCDSAAEQQTIRPGRGAGTAVVAPPAAAAPSSAPAAAEAAARAASAASAPRTASTKESGPAAPAAASTAVPTAATARTATQADCGKPRKQGTTLTMRAPAGSTATTEPQQRPRDGQKAESGC
jgi:hypothetical protein